jgi:hypothetical protein
MKAKTRHYCFLGVSWNDIEEFFFVYDESFNLNCSLAVSQIHETPKPVRKLDLQTQNQGPFQL